MKTFRVFLATLKYRIMLTIVAVLYIISPGLTYLIKQSLQSLSRVWLIVTPWTADSRPPCPSPTPGPYSNSGPLSQWCHPTISTYFVPFSCSQSFSASGSFRMSQFFASSGQSTGVSASTSVLPMNFQHWFTMDWLDLLAVPGTLRSLL